MNRNTAKRCGLRQVQLSTKPLTTLFNALYWRERAGIFEISGIILMLAAVFLINYKPDKTGERDKGSRRWGIYCALFFLFSGLVGIIFRFHQSADKANTDEMMIFASFIATAGLTLLFLVKRIFFCGALRPKGRQEARPPELKNNLFVAAVAALCGAVSCVYNRLNIYNAGVMDSLLFFPLFNGGVVMISFVLGWVFFKEKPTKLQISGILTGIAAILAISRLFGVLSL